MNDSNVPTAEMSETAARLCKLEGAYDSLKVVRPMTLATVSLMLAVMVFGFAFVGTQLASVGGQIGRLDAKIDANATRLDAKIDAIPQRLAEEFRAMRAEMSAQTSAIANAVTAARASPAQVLLVPVQPQTATAPKQ
jgi:phosphoglycerate-specific signal transduction histidine kinase